MNCTLFFLETKTGKTVKREQLAELHTSLYQPTKNLLRIFLEGMAVCLMAPVDSVPLGPYYLNIDQICLIEKQKHLQVLAEWAAYQATTKLYK